ncbi:MAG: energy transducer TonB [Elusimicrobiota bacterium]
MERKMAAFVIGVLVLISAALLSRRRDPPPEPVAQPMESFLTGHKNSRPKKINSPAPPALVAPRLENMQDLQANIRKYYPEAEHAAGKEGRVKMALVVGADGHVSDAHVVTSGGADFDEAAKKVVLAMSFAPARSAGKPAAVEIEEEIDFQFDGK